MTINIYSKRDIGVIIEKIYDVEVKNVIRSCENDIACKIKNGILHTTKNKILNYVNNKTKNFIFETCSKTFNSDEIYIRLYDRNFNQLYVTNIYKKANIFYAIADAYVYSKGI
jgi:hypothetical protein